MKRQFQEAHEVDVLTLDETDQGWGLVVFNDDVNTFDHVIVTLVKVCGHDPHQAEQCAIIIHNKGKCEVKRGDFDYLLPMKVAILDQGINAAIV